MRERDGVGLGMRLWGYIRDIEEVREIREIGQIRIIRQREREIKNNR